ncbi:DUF448 domain-containing protein [Gordonia iterans]|uniref:DUF448 domain-containing protein n=1 Tax=Gordonia iterans TaxID=1004901 RepID=A0A2S0KFI7_9ACTN|nr:YlxR family protein [Gordonia iterans]AVM00433.1 DUF448 domain-containing protein [Gordonia iterans]
MCLGCRERGPVTELVRVAVVGVPECGRERARLVIDHRRNLPGRGAWLHPSQSCVAAAVRRQAFGPALRVRGLKVQPDDLAELFGVAGHEGSAGSQDR